MEKSVPAAYRKILVAIEEGCELWVSAGVVVKVIGGLPGNLGIGIGLRSAEQTRKPFDQRGVTCTCPEWLCISRQPAISCLSGNEYLLSGSDETPSEEALVAVVATAKMVLDDSRRVCVLVAIMIDLYGGELSSSRRWITWYSNEAGNGRVTYGLFSFSDNPAFLHAHSHAAGPSFMQGWSKRANACTCKLHAVCLVLRAQLDEVDEIMCFHPADVQGHCVVVVAD